MAHHLSPLIRLVGAQGAGEGALEAVREQVVAQGRRPAEGAAALRAHVWPDLGVLAHVAAQQVACLEGLATVLAHKGAALLVLCGLVRAQGVAAVRGVLALVTPVWLLPCVRGHVVLQLVGPLAGVTTYRAQVLGVRVVFPHVDLEAGGLGAGVLAQPTAIGLLACVDATVPGDFLAAPCAVRAQPAPVQLATTMAARVVLQHHLVPTGKVA